MRLEAELGKLKSENTRLRVLLRYVRACEVAMVLTRDDREQALDEAIEAASDALDAWTDDEDERDRLWVLFAGGAFVETFISADAAARESIADRLNDHFKALGWKLTQ